MSIAERIDDYLVRHVLSSRTDDVKGLELPMLLSDAKTEIERLRRELDSANDRFAAMNTPTEREIELTHELSETEKQLTIQRNYRKLADVQNQRLRAKLASERFCRETFEGIANAYTVRCARCGTGHVFPADVSPELYFSVLACHNGCF